MSIRIGSGITVAIACLLASAAAFAAGPGVVRKQVEASMLVTGKIQVDTAGKVTGFTLDEKEKLPVGVVDLIGNAVPAWAFEPVLVGGQPANVTTDMSVRVIANQIDDDSYSIGIRSAGFGDRAAKRPRLAISADRDSAGMCKMTPPPYPLGAARAGIGSNVYLLLKTGRDGKVLDVIAEQVNLKVVATENSMVRWRRVFADVAMGHARKWCIEPPSDGEAALREFHVVRVPVSFNPGRELPAYGRWEAYVPGPRQFVPWEREEEGKGFSPDTLAPGRAYIAGSGLKLLTELSES